MHWQCFDTASAWSSLSIIKLVHNRLKRSVYSVITTWRERETGKWQKSVTDLMAKCWYYAKKNTSDLMHRTSNHWILMFAKIEQHRKCKRFDCCCLKLYSNNSPRVVLSFHPILNKRDWVYRLAVFFINHFVYHFNRIHKKRLRFLTLCAIFQRWNHK